MGHIRRLTFLIFFVLLFESTICWDVDDLELFDLVEEVNANFYDLLEVPKTATSSEIKKAYRKKTLVLHPDKSEAEDAEEKFRQLVAVYEVLKDEEKREKYNQVLENGLPDWRQPVYYYRKARKMGILELAIVLCLVITVGQYFVLWAVYLERRLALEDFFMSKKKREKKGKKKAATINDQIEEHMQETLDSLPKPGLRDLWPFTMSAWFFRFAISIPANIKARQERKKWEEEERRRIEEELEKQQRMEEEMKKEQELRKQKRKQKAEKQPRPQLVSGVAPVVYGMDNPADEAEEEEEEDYKQVVKAGEWTDEDYVMLSKAYIKFPGGTANRWEKIAEMVGRPVNEVTVRCKKMKGSYQMNLSSTVQAGTKTSKKNVGISDEIISTKEPEVIGVKDTETDTTVRKRHKHKVAKDSDRTLMISQPNVKTGETASEIKTEPGTEVNSQTPAVRPALTKSSQSQNGIKSTAANASNNKTVMKVKVEKQDNKVEESDKQSKKKEAVYVEANEDDPEAWSQNQQVILEWALRQYPKGTEQRWEKVAEHIPGKTKEDCVARFKYLAELVKQKKSQS